MDSLPVFAALLFASPLFPAARGGATAIDSAGNVWLTGQTNYLPTTATAFQKTAVSNVCGTQDLSPFQAPTAIMCAHAYLIEQDPSGKVLYATYLAGGSQDGGTAITTDAQGNIYVTGYTYSADFPVTAGVVQPKNAGPLGPTVFTELGAPFGPAYVLPGGDVFVAKFASNGTLLFCTFLGGSGSDLPSLIAVDSSGSIYVSGITTSTNFPLTAGSMTHQASNDFFACLNATATALTYSTYSAPSILAFDVDNQGRAYLTGYSSPSASTGGPYVTVIDTQAGAVLSSTFLPNIAVKINGAGVAIAMNAAQNLFLAVSPAPLPANPYENEVPTYPLGAGYFLELPADASRILAETDMSQTRFDSLLIDASGNAYAFGYGTGAIPATINTPQLLALPCSPSGGTFVLESNPAGKIVAATYFRQADDTAISLISPGRFLLYRIGSSTTVTLDLTLQPAAWFGCPLNLASGVAGPGLAPGEIFVIEGYGLGPVQGIGAAPNAAGFYPTSLGGVQVLFNSQPAPLLFVQANEIHAVAPLYVPQGAAIQVQYGTQTAPALDAALASVNPGIFTVNGLGAIVNQDGTVNTPANPASLGSIVSIYATGTGYLETVLTDGQLTPIPPPYITTQFADTVTFAGVPGITTWSGSAPGLIAGVTQINVQLPAALPSGTALGTVTVILAAADTLSPPALISVKQ